MIAVYDKDDPKTEDAKILWSFHIWVTEVKEQHLGMNVKGNSYTVLDRNLGATSVIPGERSSIGLLYQWGRKDPFVGTGEYGKIVMPKCTMKSEKLLLLQLKVEKVQAM